MASPTQQTQVRTPVAAPREERPLTINNIHQVRAALGACTFPGGFEQQQVWAETCKNALKKAAGENWLSELPKIILAIRGETPENPGGVFNATSLPRRFVAALREHGEGEEVVAICTVADSSCQKTPIISFQDVEKVVGATIRPGPLNRERAITFERAGGAMMGYVAAYLTPADYLRTKRDGSGAKMSLPETVASIQAEFTETAVRNNFDACLRNVKVGPDVEQCTVAGVRVGLFDRSQRALAGM